MRLRAGKPKVLCGQAVYIALVGGGLILIPGRDVHPCGVLVFNCWRDCCWEAHGLGALAVGPRWSWALCGNSGVSLRGGLPCVLQSNLGYLAYSSRPGSVEAGSWQVSLLRTLSRLLGSTRKGEVIICVRWGSKYFKVPTIWVQGPHWLSLVGAGPTACSVGTRMVPDFLCLGVGLRSWALQSRKVGIWGV